MSVLVIADHDNAELKPSTLNTVTAASQIDGDAARVELVEKLRNEAGVI